MAVDSGLRVPIGVLAAHRLSATARLAYAWLLAEGLAERGEGQVDAAGAQRALGLPADQFRLALNELEDYGVIRLVPNIGTSTSGDTGSALPARPEGVGQPDTVATATPISYELTPLDEIDWSLLGAAEAAAAWPTGTAGEIEVAVAGLPEGVGGLDGGRESREPLRTPPTVQGGAPAGLHGTPDRLLTLDQRVQKYGLEPTLARAYQQVGAAFTPEVVQMLVGWAEEDSFHFPPAVIGLIVDECVRRGKLHPRYMQAVAEAWAQQGVRSVPQAQAMIAQQREYSRLYQAICHRLNLARRLTQDEMALCRKWVDEWGFSEEAVLAACGETVKTTSPSFRYIDAVLAAWYDRRIAASATAASPTDPSGTPATDGSAAVRPMRPGVGAVTVSAVAPAGRQGAAGPAGAPDTPGTPDTVGASDTRGAGGPSGRGRPSYGSRGETEKRRRQDYWGAYRRMVGRIAVGEGASTSTVPAQTGAEGSER